MNKKLTIVLLLIVELLLLLCFCQKQDSAYSPSPFPNDSTTVSSPLDTLLTPNSEIETFFQNRSSYIIVTIKGVVSKILSDDTLGDRHQRFIVKLSNSRTLLITHNIDIAPRVTGISTTSIVYVHGEYMWNDQGGLVHWTHHDPAGTHEGGWIEYVGKRYQ